MGLQLNVDLETNQGPSQQVYIRVEQVTIQKYNGRMIISTSGWLDENVSQQPWAYKRPGFILQREVKRRRRGFNT